jgi:aldehyde dehydrogenase (NAD+)
MAPQTPMGSRLVKEAGIPAGVVNVLNGTGREVGSAIAAHADIDMITFTGSTPTGKQIMSTKMRLVAEQTCPWLDMMPR